MRFLLAKSKLDMPAISDVAIITPAIGEHARPILDANCILNIILEAIADWTEAGKAFPIPSIIFFTRFGTKSPNAKKEAFPLRRRR